MTGAFWYRAHFLCVRRAPRWALSAILWGCTAFFFLVLRKIPRAVGRNLAVPLGQAGFFESRRRIWRTLHAFAWCLTERYELAARLGSPQVEVENRAAWDGVAGPGGGFIVLTAHLGNWEVASAMLCERLDRSVHLVREKEVSPAAQRFVSDLAARRDPERLLTHFAGDLRLGLELRAALARSEIVALQGDRPRAGGRTVPATLFGRPFDLPAGPLVLARLTGVPVLPAFAFREGRWRYRIAFRDPIRVGSAAGRGEDLEEAARQVAAALEWAIARAPYQWFCFRQLWPDRTHGSGA